VIIFFCIYIYIYMPFFDGRFLFFQNIFFQSTFNFYIERPKKKTNSKRIMIPTQKKKKIEKTAHIFIDVRCKKKKKQLGLEK